MEIKKYEQKITDLRVEILSRMIDLATAGFGLVAALAWNDAIKALFDAIFPKAGNLIAQFLYAVIITVFVVLITLKLGKMMERTKQEWENGENKLNNN